MVVVGLGLLVLPRRVLLGRPSPPACAGPVLPLPGAAAALAAEAGSELPLILGVVDVDCFAEVLLLLRVDESCFLRRELDLLLELRNSIRARVAARELNALAE